MKPVVEPARSAIVHGAKVHLTHATHAGGHFLPAGASGEVVSLHRLHARVAVSIDEGRVVVRLPLEVLRPVA
jgi:hypothetical protein